MSKVIYVVAEADGPTHSAYDSEKDANDTCKELGFGYYVAVIDYYYT
jgi:hypothetical protein